MHCSKNGGSKKKWCEIRKRKSFFIITNMVAYYKQKHWNGKKHSVFKILKFSGMQTPFLGNKSENNTNQQKKKNVKITFQTFFYHFIFSAKVKMENHKIKQPLNVLALSKRYTTWKWKKINYLFFPYQIWKTVFFRLKLQKIVTSRGLLWYIDYKYE